jgi:VanZ family protein
MTMGLFRYCIKFWLPVILWMCFIFWMSTDTFSFEHTASLVESTLYVLFPRASAQAVDLIHTLIRKLGHFSEFFVLGILLFRAFRGGTSKKWSWRWTSLTLIILFTYAASDEFHQSFTQSRGASVKDVGIDALGGILSLIVIALVYRRHRRS